MKLSLLLFGLLTARIAESSVAPLKIVAGKEALARLGLHRRHQIFEPTHHHHHHHDSAPPIQKQIIEKRSFWGAKDPDTKQRCGPGNGTCPDNQW
jgi:hypothetical protein